MRKYLLPECGNFYKANLHCHSNCSDGKLTPEEIKDLYKRHGYSIVAYTDHNILLDHSDLADNEFLPLLGYEVDIQDFVVDQLRKTCHMCFISLEPDNIQVCWHRSGKYLFRGGMDRINEVKIDPNAPDYDPVYSANGINDMIKKAKAHGYFVTYNHPYWSVEGYPEYTKYMGMDAMEVINGSCLSLGYDEYNTHAYDDLLRTGHKLYCIAADDNHNNHPEGSRRCDSLIGVTMIKAEKLEYRTVTKAMEDGHFYATTGPEIHELWFEGEELHIECSDADRVTLNTGTRRAAVAFPEEGELTLNKATFKVSPKDKYVRLTVFDRNGKCAYTNAYFTDEIYENERK